MVIDGDTLVAITVKQAKKVDKTFMERNYYKTVTDTLGKKIILLESKLENDSLIIDAKNVQIDNLELIIINKQVVIDRQKDDLVATDKELRKEKRWGVFSKVGLKVSAVINIVLILVIIGSK